MKRRADKNISDKFKGSMLGLAVGDALGAPLEFKRPGAFMPLDEITNGEWTDDTSMALCLAESLIEKGGFDPKDQLDKYSRWLKEGYLSGRNRAFGVGNAVYAALMEYEKSGAIYCGSEDPNSAGNGCIMRLAPVPLFYFSDPLQAIERSIESSRTTHQARTCLDACGYMGGIIVGLLNGASKEEVLSERYSPIEGYWDDNPMCEEIKAIAGGAFKRKEPPEITGSGYVVNSLEAALWAFYKSRSFKEGVLMAVNLGEDADTTGAVYGQIAGAYYGFEEIPKEWVKRLNKLDLLLDIEGRLREKALNRTV